MMREIKQRERKASSLRTERQRAGRTDGHINQELDSIILIIIITVLTPKQEETQTFYSHN